MKLRSPEIIIPPEEPFRNDKFNRIEYANSLRQIFSKIEDNIIISIDANWGEGKTTFAKMFIADLKRNNINCIYYDAYKNDYTSDPFYSFSSEIIQFIKNQNNDNLKSHDSEFRKLATKILKNIVISTTRLGMKVAANKISDYVDIELLKEYKDDLSAIPSDVLSSLIEWKFENYQKEKELIDKFQESLVNIGIETRKVQNFPLLIIIDELDRCRPDYALLLLERIKHFFCVDNISFILLTNMTQIECYINKIYGIDVKASEYLHKFYTIKSSFPMKRVSYGANDYKQYYNHLTSYHGITSLKDFDFVGPQIYRHLKLSLREMEKCFSLMTIYSFNNNTNKKGIVELLPIIPILKVRRNDLYEKLKNGELNYSDIYDF